jgi:tRNA(Glu) U13 pseudouridine synthase TruD
LRVRLEEPSFVREPGAVRLRFVLPAGSYATVLCECLFPALRQPPIS